jgi:5-methylcytosine-specific restriction endonuclease McrA
VTIEERRTYDREYYAKNREKILGQKTISRMTRAVQIAVSKKGYNRANPEKVAQWNRTSHKRHAETNRMTSAVYRLANQEKVQLLTTQWKHRNPEKVAAWNMRWMRANLGKCRLKTAERRSLKYDNTPINELLTEKQWKDVLATYDGHCAYCGEKCDNLTIDHVIPLSQSGSHSIANVVPACKHCNCTKGARTPKQWRRDLRSGNGCRPLELVREQSLILGGV